MIAQASVQAARGGARAAVLSDRADQHESRGVQSSADSDSRRRSDRHRLLEGIKGSAFSMRTREYILRAGHLRCPASVCSRDLQRSASARRCVRPELDGGPPRLTDTDSGFRNAFSLLQSASSVAVEPSELIPLRAVNFIAMLFPELGDRVAAIRRESTPRRAGRAWAECHHRRSHEDSRA